MNLAPVTVWLLAASVVGGAAYAQLPSDVRPGHWAAEAVRRTVKAGVLKVQSDGRFHGDAKVTRLETVSALAALGRKLVDGKWTAEGKSRPVPDSVSAVWEKTDWKAEPVRRYTFVAITARFADYVANALKRPPAGAEVGKSEALPAVTLTLAPGSPGYASLKYLAANRMIRPGSPLLKPDSSTVSGGELSRALADLATGVTDRLTELQKETDNPTGNGPPPKRPAP